MAYDDTHKRPHNCLVHPEDLQDASGVSYAFTINPRNTINYNNLKSFRKAYLEFVEDFQAKMIKIKSIKYSLNIESSSNGKLHFHGYLEILNPVDFYFRDLRSLEDVGSYLIKPIDKPDVWAEYIDKQASFWEKIKDKYIIPVHFMNDTKIIYTPLN